MGSLWSQGSQYTTWHVGSSCDHRLMSESTGFRVYPPGERGQMAKALGIFAFFGKVTQVPDYDPKPVDPERILRWGVYLGFGIGILLTLVVYLVLRADPYDEGSAMLFIWASPVLIGALLAVLPRTRYLGIGLLAGTGLSWIIGVPTCVVVTLNTLPM